MKVAYLLGSLNVGGTEKLILNSFNNSNFAEFDIYAVHRKGGDLKENFEKSGISLSHIFPKHKFDVFYFFRLRKFFIKNQIDIIHAQQPIDALFAKISCFGVNKKIILTLHGFDFNSSFLSKKILSFIIKKSDLNIYVSEYLKSYYCTKFKLKSQKQKVVYNGVYAGNHEGFDLKNNIRKELDIPENKKILISVGSFVDIRNQKIICLALKELKDLKNDFVFLFIGRKDKVNPEFYETCYSFCEENQLLDFVYFLGVRNDVNQLLKASNLFVYSSNHDTFGISVVEAIQTGIPTLINDWEVMKEISENGNLATLYKSNNQEDLKEKICDILANYDIYEKKAQENSIFAKKKFSIENYFKKLKELYQIVEIE